MVKRRFFDIDKSHSSRQLLNRLERGRQGYRSICIVQYEATADKCLDNKGTAHLSDKAVMKYLNELGISSSSALQRMEKEERDAIIRKMKAMQDVSIRQLSRITGISKSVIDRI